MFGPKVPPHTRVELRGWPRLWLQCAEQHPMDVFGGYLSAAVLVGHVPRLPHRVPLATHPIVKITFPTFLPDATYSKAARISSRG